MAELKNAKKKKKGYSKKNTVNKKNVVNETVVEKVKKEKDVKINEIVDEANKVKENKNTRSIVIALIAGIVIGLVVMLFFMPDRIAKLQNGEEVIVQIGDESITADNLYTDMKEYYSVNILLDKIDSIVLPKIYPEDNDMKTEVNNMADYYISMYETYYGYTEEQFLEANGFKSRDAFINALTLDYRRTKCFNEYVKSLISDSDIEKYYNNNVYGDIETKYIKVSGTDDDAKSLAERVITRLKDGESYESVVEHYGDRIATENLGYISFDNSLDTTYLNALKALKDNSYTETPVKGTDDYKVIFRGNSKEKASLDEVKEKIITILSNEKVSNDQTLNYKALIEMRKNNNVSFKDTDLAKKYENYVKTNTANDKNDK